MTGQKMTLTIMMDPQGNIGVNADPPFLNNRLICYGMLEAARDAIQAFGDQQKKSPISLATPGDVVDITRNSKVQ